MLPTKSASVCTLSHCTLHHLVPYTFNRTHPPQLHPYRHITHPTNFILLLKPMIMHALTWPLTFIMHALTYILTLFISHAVLIFTPFIANVLTSHPFPRTILLTCIHLFPWIYPLYSTFHTPLTIPTHMLPTYHIHTSFTAHVRIYVPLTLSTHPALVHTRSTQIPTHCSLVSCPLNICNIATASTLGGHT